MSDTIAVVVAPLALATTGSSEVSQVADSLSRIYTILLSLGLAEAFKQFVRDKADMPEDRHVEWNRLPALLSVTLVVLPFFHGMERYFVATYSSGVPASNYDWRLLVDTVVFAFEGAVVFFMSRALSMAVWDRFYAAAALLFLVDSVWAAVSSALGAKGTLSWAVINVAAAVSLKAVLVHRDNLRRFVCGRDSGVEIGGPEETVDKETLHEMIVGESRPFAVACFIVVVLRTIADCYASWDVYFPEGLR